VQDQAAAESWIQQGARFRAARGFAEALACFRQATGCVAQHPVAWFGAADALCHLGHLDTALACFDQALKCRPDYLEALAGKGNLLNRQGHCLAALDCFRQAVALNPALPELWLNQGIALHGLQRYPQALESYDQALALRPDYLEVLVGKGVCLNQLKRPQSALRALRAALRIAPGFAEAWHAQGVALCLRQRHEQGLASFQRALEICPEHVLAWIGSGLALHDLGRFETALASFDRALALNPQQLDAWKGRGLCLNRLQRHEEALVCCQRVLQTHPECAETWSNQGATLVELMRHEEALVSYERALDLDPDLADAHWNEALARLQLGQFGIGWKKYEYRWRRRQHPPLPPYGIPAPQKLSQLRGQRLLVWVEQGMGDIMQFCRYIPLLEQLGAQVLFQVPPALKRLMQSLGAGRVIAGGEPCPPCDLQISLLSLPLLFGTTLQSIPATLPYLAAEAGLSAKWRARLNLETDKPNVAIACCGNSRHLSDAKRSLALAHFAPLADVAHLFMIQTELRAADAEFLARRPDIRWLGAEIDDFADSAAIVSLMDCVVSVDTSLAHLAGALNRPLWLLLRECAEWRWLLERSDSPWYPGARLVRLARAQSPAAAMAHIAAQLQSMQADPLS